MALSHSGLGPVSRMSVRDNALEIQTLTPSIAKINTAEKGEGVAEGHHRDKEKKKERAI